MFTEALFITWTRPDALQQANGQQTVGPGNSQQQPLPGNRKEQFDTCHNLDDSPRSGAE